MQPEQNNQPQDNNQQAVKEDSNVEKQSLTQDAPDAQGPVENQPPEQASAVNTEEPAANWAYASGPQSDEGFEQPAGDQSMPESVEWTASEFVDHYKSTAWYLGLAGVILVIVSLTYLLTKDLITAVMLLIVGVTFGIVAGRPPRTLAYRMTRDGVTIQSKFIPFLEFKSFSVADEGAVSMISLVPLKRFMPLTYIYYPPEQEEAIMAILSNQLPFEERRSDPVDVLMRHLRF